MSQAKTSGTRRFALPVKQTRSAETRDKLLNAGFKLLRRKRFEEFSVADVAGAAGVSVGAFYVRFEDKEQYFQALADQFREMRRAEVDSTYANSTLKTMVRDALARELATMSEHTNLWRAALRKSAVDPDFWTEFRELGRHATDKFLAKYTQLLGRPLSLEETEHVRFAFQVVRSTLNNTMLNQPGPLRLGDDEFRRQIERAFRLIAGIDA